MANNLSGMLWIEFRKALRSGVPLWTAPVRFSCR